MMAHSIVLIVTGLEFIPKTHAPCVEKRKRRASGVIFHASIRALIHPCIHPSIHYPYIHASIQIRPSIPPSSNLTRVLRTDQVLLRPTHKSLPCNTPSHSSYVRRDISHLAWRGANSPGELWEVVGQQKSTQGLAPFVLKTQ